MIVKIYIAYCIIIITTIIHCYYTIHQIFFVSIRLLSIRFCYRLVGMAIIWTKTIAERFGLRSESLPASNSQCFSWRPGRLWASDSSSCGPCSCAQFRHSTLRGWVRVSPYHVSWSSIQKWPLENNRPNGLRFEQKLSHPASSSGSPGNHLVPRSSPASWSLLEKERCISLPRWKRSQRV